MQMPVEAEAVDLELQVVVSGLMQLPESELRSLEKQCLFLTAESAQQFTLLLLKKKKKKRQLGSAGGDTWRSVFTEQSSCTLSSDLHTHAYNKEINVQKEGPVGWQGR